MFWTISILILLAAGLLALWPLFGKDSGGKMFALAAILMLPLAGYWLYQGVGSPQGLDPELAQVAHPDSSGAPDGMSDMNVMAERLRERLTETPEDMQGWLLLGRSYKSLQQYPQALEALETADRLVPGQPLVQVELVEARLFVSGDPQITPEMTAQLEQAVGAEPGLQKGLWLLGIAAAQAGDDARALEWWEQLRQQIEPNSPIEQSVIDQINQVKARLGEPAETASPPATIAAQAAPAAVPEQAALATGAWPGAAIRVELSAADTQAEVPAGAVLFIIVREESAGPGPPLGAKRVNQPQFPLQVTLTDGDSMMAQRPISSSPNLRLQARLSLSGQANPSAGDWQSTPATVSAQGGQTTTLILDQKVE